MQNVCIKLIKLDVLKIGGVCCARFSRCYGRVAATPSQTQASAAVRGCAHGRALRVMGALCFALESWPFGLWAMVLYHGFEQDTVLCLAGHSAMSAVGVALAADFEECKFAQSMTGPGVHVLSAEDPVKKDVVTCFSSGRHEDNPDGATPYQISWGDHWQGCWLKVRAEASDDNKQMV